jgi:hypothetical protein
MPAPAIVDKALFSATQEQLRENRTRARLGPRRPGHLLQGLTCCALCGYAFYGKTTRQRGKGHRLTDFRYYRCSGTDADTCGSSEPCQPLESRTSAVSYWACYAALRHHHLTMLKPCNYVTNLALSS